MANTYLAPSDLSAYVPNTTNTVIGGIKTFPSAPVFPAGFVVGSTFVNTSGSELNFLVGVTSGIQAQLNAKQATLVSGTSIKTLNGDPLLGSGNIVLAAPAWGAITGTLSAQTDLQTALNLKANLISPAFTTPNIGVASGTSLALSGNLSAAAITATTIDAKLVGGYGAGGFARRTIPSGPYVGLTAIAAVDVFNNIAGFVFGDNLSDLVLMDRAGTAALTVSPAMGVTLNRMTFLNAGSVFAPSVTVDFSSGNECGIYMYGGLNSSRMAVVTKRLDRIRIDENGLVQVVGNLSAAAITASGAVNLAGITKAALLALTPTATTGGRWRVTDASPAQRSAYPDGTNWRYTSDDAIVV